MNRQIEEQLSAMLDGEASDLELRRVLQQLDSCSEQERQQLYARWDRLNRARHSMQPRSSSNVAAPEFVDSVAAVITDLEPDQCADTSTDTQRASQQMPAPVWSKFAVAASVALAVIAVFQQSQISTQRADLELALAQQLQQRQIEQRSFPSQAFPASQFAGFGANQPQVAGPDKSDQLLERRRIVDQYLLEYAQSPEFQDGFERCEIRCDKR